MTESTGGGFPWGFSILMVLALLLYMIMAPMIASSRSSDAAGNGMAVAMGVFVGIALWIVLAVALLIARSHGAVPGWVTASLCVLVPLGAIGVSIAAGFWSDRGGWGIVLPLGAPLFVAFYAAWARLPVLQGLVPGEIANAGIVAVLAAATVLPFVAMAF